MKVLACYSLKGGVGKTACAVNLAYLAAAAGINTLLVDLDPQGASSFYFRMKPGRKKWSERFFKAYEALVKLIKASDYEHLDVIPAHLSYRKFDVWLAEGKRRKSRLRRVLKGFSSEYQLIILDCPPGIGYLAEAVFEAADRILVPVVPTTLSERSFEQLLAFFKDHDYARKRIRPVFSLVQARKSLHAATLQDMCERYPAFFRTRIPFSRDVENMGVRRAPVAAFAPRGVAAQAFEDLFEELAGDLKLP